MNWIDDTVLLWGWVIGAALTLMLGGFIAKQTTSPYLREAVVVYAALSAAFFPVMFPLTLLAIVGFALLQIGGGIFALIPARRLHQLVRYARWLRFSA